MDSDTYVAEDFSEIFQLLDRFDLALLQSPFEQKYRLKDVPDCFPEFNCGIILYKNEPKVYDLFRTWKVLYERDLVNAKQLMKPNQGCLQDQPTFREAIYHSDVRVATLPPEYNCSINNPGRLLGKVKIFQGRHPSFPNLARKMNKKVGERVYVRASEARMIVIHRKKYFPWREKLNKARSLIKEKGFLRTISYISAKFFG